MSYNKEHKCTNHDEQLSTIYLRKIEEKECFFLQNFYAEYLCRIAEKEYFFRPHSY